MSKIKRLTLKKPVKKILELTTPAGKLLKLVIKQRTFDEVKNDQSEIKKLTEQMEAGEITAGDYIDNTLKNMIENYKYDDFKDFDMDHITAIMQAINELNSDTRSTDEKKSQSKKNMKS